MPKLFISYRRDDSDFPSHALYEALKAKFGGGSVFIDVDSIPPGVDFRRHLSDWVSQCDILFAVIGQHWVNATDATGTRRLDDPRDFVRIEIEAALKRDIPVIPVLVGRVSMPREDDLPVGLKELAYRNAVELRSGRDFPHGVSQLLEGLERLLNAQSEQRVESTNANKPRAGEPALLLRLCPHCHRKLRFRNVRMTKGQTKPFACPRCKRSLRLIHDGNEIQAIVELDRPAAPAPEDGWDRLHDDLFKSEPLSSQDPWDRIADELRCNLPTEAEPLPEQQPQVAGNSQTVGPAEGILDSLIGLRLKRIPGGEFVMGAAASDRHASEYEKPQHPVTISNALYVGVSPVTQAEYHTVMQDNPSHFRGDDRQPVEQVSWLDAIEFCNRLSKLDRLTPYYEIDGGDIMLTGGIGYRLPTEAEWEYVCRAGTTSRWSFGDDVSMTKDYAWYSVNSGGETHPVGQLKPNDWGLFDMHGLVWEWCEDWFGKKYFSESPTADPRGPTKGRRRVLRGGAFSFPATDIRSSNRISYDPNYRGLTFGFRVARFCETS